MELLGWNIFRSTGPMRHPVYTFLQSIHLFLSFYKFWLRAMVLAGVHLHIKHELPIFLWGRAVAVKTASGTALSGFMLCIQKNLLHVPTVMRRIRAPAPHSSHCHYHCHCCYSWGAPPRNCWGWQAVAETVHLSHSCCAGAVAILLNETTL